MRTKKKEEYVQKHQPNCPEGYTVAIPGQVIDMLDKSELWVIRSNNPEPHLTRIPQDLVMDEFGSYMTGVPKEWGYVLYYKVV